ncbi:LpqB family beta-propeller domain-containing protein [Streptomyces sp. NPDC002671]
MPLRAVTYGLCSVALLAGCASMPDSGGLTDVESTPQQDSQVRVFAMPPKDNAQPSEIVSGFLEALTSDDPNYSRARQYLTKAASDAWKPGLSTTVLADGPGIDTLGGRKDGDTLSFTLTGTKVATLDAQQAYSPANGAYNTPVHLTRDKKTKQWRIDSLPQGVVIGNSDFQRNYISVNKYYFASDTAVGMAAQPVAVADPVYVRRRMDPITQTVRSLLNGPTNWLDPVVRTSFPAGTALQKDVTTLTPDDQNKLIVPLNTNAARIGERKCNEMAAQLLFTLQSLTPAVDQVELRSGSSRLCSLSKDLADAVASRASVEHPDYLYFVDSRHRLARLAADNNSIKAELVPGVLGEGNKQLRSAAVSRDEHTAAGVSADGKDLYVAALASIGSLGAPVLVSHGKTDHDRLTAPSWDRRGDLWVADRDPDNPRLLLLEHGNDEPLVVRTPELPGRIKAVRVAADGVRIALVVEKGSKQSLLMGRIEREKDENDERSTFSLHELRVVTPELEQTRAMSWAGDSRMVVIGTEPDGVEQIQYVQCDGSISNEGPLPSVTEVTNITASGNREIPLVVTSKEGLLELSNDGWKPENEVALAVFYPG